MRVCHPIADPRKDLNVPRNGLTFGEFVDLSGRDVQQSFRFVQNVRPRTTLYFFHRVKKLAGWIDTKVVQRHDVGMLEPCRNFGFVQKLISAPLKLARSGTGMAGPFGLRPFLTLWLENLDGDGAV